jgi:tetratricopeptide (TPR) repeat protein
MAAALPADPRALRLATETMAGVRRFEAALGMAQAWRRLSPEDSYEPDLAAAQLQGMLGRPADGLATLLPHRERILAEADAKPGRLALLAELLARDAHEVEARALLEPRARDDADWARRQIAIASVLRTRPDACRAWLAACEPMLGARPELDVALGDGWRTLAQSTGDRQDYARAGELLAAACSRAPSSNLLVTLAETQQGAGDPSAAEGTLRRALELGEDPVALNNLAALLSEQRPSDPEARRLAARAVEIARGAKIPAHAVAPFLDTLGYAQLRAGSAAEALETYTDALRLDPSLVDSLVGSAEAAHALGKDDEARAALQRLPATEALPRHLAPRVAELRRSVGAN